jgi:hypothetical protein
MKASVANAVGHTDAPIFVEMVTRLNVPDFGRTNQPAATRLVEDLCNLRCYYLAHQIARR